MTTRPRPSTAYIRYKKADIVNGLKESIAAIERTTKTFDEKVTEWKETAVAKYAEAVEKWQPGNSWYFNEAPPKRSPLCEDWRVQAINRSLLRIEAMTMEEDSSIRLRADDKVFEQMAYASCL